MQPKKKNLTTLKSVPIIFLLIQVNTDAPIIFLSIQECVKKVIVREQEKKGIKEEQNDAKHLFDPLNDAVIILVYARCRSLFIVLKTFGMFKQHNRIL